MAESAFEAHPGLSPRWREVAADEPLLSSVPWLTMRAPKADGEATTFLVSSATTGTPIAGMFTVTADGGVADPAFDVRELLTGSPRTLMPGRAHSTLAVGGGEAGSWYPHLVVAYPGYESYVAGPGRSSPGIVDELVDGIVEWSRSNGHKAVAFLYTVPGQPHLEAALARRGFIRLEVTATCDLVLPGDTFDDYLATLPRKRRTEVRRERRVLTARGVTTRPAALADVFDDLVRLRLNHAARYGRKVSEEKERARLTALVERFGEGHVLVFVATAQSEHDTLAFSVVLDHRGEWYVLDSGADYDNPLHVLTYFDACYYVPIETAYDRGVGVLHYSLGSWDAKRYRGCTLVPRDGWVLPLTAELRDLLDHGGVGSLVLVDEPQDTPAAAVE